MRWILVLLLLVALSSCVVHRFEVTPVEVTGESPIVVTAPVKAHLYDGSTVVFPDGITVSDNVVHGNGRRYDLTLETSTRVSEVSLDDIAAIESYQTPVNIGATTAATAVSSVGIIYVAAAAAYLVFGSCPTVYSFDGGEALLEAELFSYSITQSFQSRDIDRLGIRTINNGILELELRNEMLETHYIDHLEVLEVIHAPDQKAYPDEKGRPLVAGNLIAPSTAVDQNGRDILNEVLQADDIAWSTTAKRLAGINSEDYMDHLDFEFDLPPDADDPALVFRLRNSLLNTVLFYDVMLKQQSFRALDWMGHDLDHLGNKIQLGLWYREHMGLTISVWDNGRYRKVTKIGDQGPIAWNERAVRVPTGGDDKLKVRLSFVADNWRFDQVAVALDSVRPKTRTVAIANASTSDGDRADIPAFLHKADKTYLITKPQDRVNLQFDVGDVPDDRARTFFLASEGYYMEWMRSEWLSEEHRETFKPDTDALLRALAIYAETRDGLREQFEATKLAVR